MSSNSSRKRTSRRISARIGHKKARQASNASIRGDKIYLPRGLGYSSRVPQPSMTEMSLVLKEGLTPSLEDRPPPATNRCGADCGRRAEVGDYLCERCRE